MKCCLSLSFSLCLQSLHPCEMISLSSLEAAHTSRHVSTSSATLPLSSPLVCQYLALHVFPNHCFFLHLDSPYTSSDIGTKLESHSSEVECNSSISNLETSSELYLCLNIDTYGIDRTDICTYV